MAEARCTELGSNCGCSEPLEATTYDRTVAQWDPNDTDTLECSAEGFPGGAIARNVVDVVASTDATALAALPAGNSVARFMRAGDGHLGIFWLGAADTFDDSFSRIAMRWYRYYSPTFQFAGEGSCTNSKVTEFNFNSRITVHVEDTTVIYSTYNYLASDGWSPDVDCCSNGPGPNTEFTTTETKGKWWRFEVVMTNREGPNYRLRMYGKNVTDDEDEVLIIDNHDSGTTDHSTPPGLMTQMLVNNYRETACTGWYGNLYYMTAGWATDSGQRIGAAEEVEGDGEAGPTFTAGNRGGIRRGRVGLLR